MPRAEAPRRDRSVATFLRALWPARGTVDLRERLRIVCGAGLGIFFAAGLSRWLGGDATGSLPWLLAPLGASAVLVFALPASPLAQPWPVIGGNTISALAGIACARWIGDPALASALAVALAIGSMFLTRSLHPPGGAMALLAVLTQQTGWLFAFFPAFVNSALLVAAAVAYNSTTGRAYPHVAQAATAPPSPARRTRFTEADLDAALDHYHQVLAVSREEIGELLEHAEAAAYQRQLGELRAADIMMTDPATLAPESSLDDAWRLLMSRGRVEALPVVDGSGHVVGIVTQVDFLRLAQPSKAQGLRERLRHAWKRPVGGGDDPRDTVASIMTRDVVVAGEDRRVGELVELFTHGGHRHLPVVAADGSLRGMVTPFDVLQTLHRAVRAAPN